MVDKSLELVHAEEVRLSALHQYAILDTPKEQRFDDIAFVVAQVLDVPGAAISFIDRDRQWFKSEVGLGVRELQLLDSSCKAALLGAGGIVVPDLTSDTLLSHNLMATTEINWRFYASVPLRTADGLSLGTLCVMDTETRPNGLSEQQRTTLEAMARQVMALLELRLARRVEVDVSNEARTQAALRHSEAKFEALTNAIPHIVFSARPDGYNDYFNEQLYQFTGLTHEQLRGEEWQTVVHVDDLPNILEDWRNSISTGNRFEREFRCLHYSGEYRWMLSRAVAIRDEDGSVVRWMGTCTDIHQLRRTEGELRDVRRRLEAALVAADVGTWTYDIASGKIYADDNFAQMHNLSDTEKCGGAAESYFSAIHPEDVCRVRRHIEAACESGGPFVDSYRVRSATGNYLHVQIRGKCDRNVTGEATWFAGIVQDITAQKDSEKALMRSEHKFKQLAQSNIIGIVDYRLDGTLIGVNDAFLDMLGYTRDEYEQNGLRWPELTPSKWHSRSMQALEELKTTGVARVYEKEYVRKDGSCVPVLIGAASFQGQEDEGVAYVLDISSIRKAELAQRESEAKFQTITNAMPQMVWSTLPNGYHDYFNDQWYEFTGVPYGSTEGERWNSIFHPDDQERAWKSWRHSLATGERYEIEYRLRHRSGQYRWTLGRALPVRNDKGHIVRWMGTCTDIHEQKATQEALRAADRRKDDFLAMLAHELRNPLAPIAAGADMLANGLAAGDKVIKLGGIISRQTRHMTALIDDLLDVSRVTRGLVTIEKVAVDVKSVVEQAVEQVRPSILARNHHLNTVFPLEEVLVTGDKSRLIQILSNLLTNAARYTPNGGRIWLQVDVEFKNVVIIVRDNGAGMTEDLIERAFEMFTQGQRSSDRLQGGLGLGLALVKSLVELHGGAVTATSQGPGLGSEFKVVLPRLQYETNTVHSECNTKGLKLSEIPLRVLIVDDNTDAAYMMGMLVEVGGCEAYIEHHPVTALERAKIVRPDICLLDIGLPEIDGIELARQLRLLPETKNAKLIAVTGYGQEHDRLVSQAAGFYGHLVKPVDLQQLKEIFKAISTAKD